MLRVPKVNKLKMKTINIAFKGADLNKSEDTVLVQI